MEIPIDVRLLEAIVHDVRNPLNVIGLTLRVIEQLPAQQRAEIEEDLVFLRDNAGQIERMLTLVGDFCRFKRDQNPPGPIAFDPGRLLIELAEDRSLKGPEKGLPLRVEIDPSAPREVTLDPTRIRYAVLFAVYNALGATDRPVVVRSSGRDGRWTIAVVVDKPPPSSVSPFAAGSERYERLIGSGGERRGLDLALAGWVVEPLGGTVRLDVEPGRRSAVVVDLPVSVA